MPADPVPVPQPQTLVGAALALNGLGLAVYAIADERFGPLWWTASAALAAQYAVLTRVLVASKARRYPAEDPAGASRGAALPSVEAHTDPITGVFNRAGILIGTDDLLRQAGSPAIVVVVDVDDFKAVDDLDGREAGDRLLGEVASVLRSLTRSGDLVGRWDGDEFVVIFPVADPSVADMLVDRVTRGVARVASATVGHTVMRPKEPGGLRAALARADVDLYTARNAVQHPIRREPLRAGSR